MSRLFLIGLSLLITHSLYADEPEFINRLKGDINYIITSPTRLNRSHWVSVGGLFVTTSLLISVDEEIRTEFYKCEEEPVLDSLSEFGELMGDGITSLGITGLFYLAGGIYENERLMRVGQRGIESFLCTGVTTWALKCLIGRSRPYQELGAYHFVGPTIESKEMSFPSGHSTSAFSLASVVASEYDNLLVDTMAYGLATLTGLSRIYDDEHWASDVFVGAALGITIGKLIAHFDDDIALSVIPDEDKLTICLSLSLPVY